LIAQPFDINHQDILSVCNVDRKGRYKPFVKEVRPRVVKRNSNISRIRKREEAVQPSGDSSPELIALRRRIPHATHDDVYDILYSFPFEVDGDDDGENMIYPESHVLDAHATTIMPNSPTCQAHVEAIRAKIARTMPALVQVSDEIEGNILDELDSDESSQSINHHRKKQKRGK